MGGPAKLNRSHVNLECKKKRKKGSVEPSCCSCCRVAKSCPTLQPHGLQHARLLCPSLSPGACLNSCPSSRWCQWTISSSFIPFSSRLQSFPASGSFPMSRLFASGDQSYRSSSINPSNEYPGLASFRSDWFDLLAVQESSPAPQFLFNTQQLGNVCK